MLKKILIGLAGLVAAFLVVVALSPAEYAVTRSAVIAASPAKVFGLINNIRRWNEWSPWAKMDPSQEIAYEGPASGVGAIQTWKGKKTGTGKMTLVTSQPNTLVAFRLEFFTPMAGGGDVEFTLVPEGKGTSITWAMRGKHNFVGKAMGMLMGMDRMLGGQFEAGLAAMKPLLEASAK